MEPNSFSCMCNHNCKHQLKLLLQTLCLHHLNSNVVILCDDITQNYIYKELPDIHLHLNINWNIGLNQYKNENRDTMTQKKMFGTFLENKMNVMKLAIKTYTDTLFLDTDIIILDKITDIDKTKEIGLSPQYLREIPVQRTGYYNAGFVWTKSIEVCDKWIELIDYGRKCPEQVNMSLLKDTFSYFEFEQNYNIQPLRFIVGIDSRRRSKAFVNIKNNKLYYKNDIFKCIHTHFEAGCYQEINKFIMDFIIKSGGYENEIKYINDYMDFFK